MIIVIKLIIINNDDDNNSGGNMITRYLRSRKIQTTDRFASDIIISFKPFIPFIIYLSVCAEKSYYFTGCFRILLIVSLVDDTSSLMPYGCCAMW